MDLHPGGEITGVGRGELQGLEVEITFPGLAIVTFQAVLIQERRELLRGQGEGEESKGEEPGEHRGGG